MKTSIYKLSIAITFAIVLILGINTSMSAQKVLATENFDTKDTATAPALPKNWTANAKDSTWTLSNVKASNDTGASGHYNLYLDSKAARLNKDIIATFAGVSTKGYSGIALMWHERISAKYLITNNTIRVDYSVDGGKTWDSIPHKIENTGIGTWGKTNNRVPILLPKVANNIANLMLRWVAVIKGTSGNYAMDDLTITATTTTGVEEVIYNNSAPKVWIANDNLNIAFKEGQAKNALISLFDINGQQVYNNTVLGNSSLPINLNNGIYISRLTIDGQVYSSKLVK